MKFTGHERDLASLAGAGDDLDYMHARYYSLFTGRFLSIDSVQGKLKTPQSWNRYVYTFNNPLKHVDPDGRDGLTFADGVQVTYETFVSTVDDVGYVVAYPMLKMGSGILNNDAAEFSAGVGLMAVDALGGIVLKEASYALRLGWTSRANLLKHFGQHGKEFGFKLAEQYGAAARRLAGSVGKEGVESVVTKTGERLIFNTSTAELAVVNKHGRIVTYFKASYKYWLSKVRQAGGAVK